MTSLAIALKALEEAAAATEALARAKRVYDVFVAEAKRANEMTPLESEALDARADVVFASDASQPSGR